MESLEDKSNYTVNKGIGNPSIIYSDASEPGFAELYFVDAFEEGEIYELTVSNSLKNCLGMNMLNDTVIGFGLAESADSKDIVINEVLFNPWTDGVDYVEIYNQSSKIIDMSVLTL